MDLTATLEQIGHAMPDLSTIVPDWMNQWFHTLGTNSVFLSTQNYMPPLLVALFLGLLIEIGRAHV